MTLPILPGLRPHPVDPQWDDVVMLLHFASELSGERPVIDSSKYARAMERGNASYSTAIYKFPPSSMFFDGSDNYVLPDDNAGPELIIGTRDFTIECFFNKGQTDGQYFIDTRPNSSGIGLAFGLTGGNRLNMDRFPSGGSTTGTLPVAGDQWYHAALSRIAGVSRGFLDGVLDFELADTTDYNSAGSLRRPVIGQSTTGATGFRGHLQEFRFTIGSGRYQGNFTPPTAPFLEGY